MRHHATSEGNILFTAEEEMEADQREAAHLAEQPKQAIRQQIAKLESSITARMLREQAAGDTTVDKRDGTTSAQKIVRINSQIAALRVQL